MDRFKNEIIHNIHTSRYVASYVKGTSGKDPKFIYMRDWLSTLVIDDQNLTEDEIDYIWQFATGGKMELELSAMAFINKK